MSANITLATIRAQYPTPSKQNRYGTHIDGEYCVGGALALAFYGHTPDIPRFPEEEAIAEMLQVLNPALSDSLALEYADSLVDRNDVGDFEEAWQIAGEALDYRQKRGPQHGSEPHV